MFVRYTGSLKIGTPGQTMNMVFDTGSADLWALSKEAYEANKKPKNFHSYDSQASSTATGSICNYWSITYGSGHVEGHYIADTLQIAGYSLKNKKFAVATEVSSIFFWKKKFKIFFPISSVSNCSRMRLC